MKERRNTRKLQMNPSCPLGCDSIGVYCRYRVEWNCQEEPDEEKVSPAPFGCCSCI